MKRILWFFVIILCLSNVTSQAQETAKADEIFAWFPQGTYTMIKHYDAELFSKGKAYPLYMEYFGPPSEQTDKADESRPSDTKESKKGSGLKRATWVGEGEVLLNHLPPSLREGLYSSTTAGVTTLADAPEDTPELKYFMFISPKAGKNSKVKSFYFLPQATMEVHRYQDLNGTIKAALEKGDITDTGKKIGRRPVYKITERAGGRGSSLSYAWAAETQELLIAQSIDHLRRMVLTDRGRMISLLDDPDMADLLGIVPDLGARWSLTSFKNSRQKLEEIKTDQGTGEEKIGRMEDRLENEPLYTIDSWTVDNEIVNRKLTVYDDSSKAEEAMESNSEVIGSSGYSQEFAKRQKYELRGNIVVCTVVYDKDLLEKEKKAMDSQAKGRGTGILIFKDGATNVIKKKD